MQRKIAQKLQNWAKKSDRKPLVIKGARQVGKTWAIKDFGDKFFAKTAYFNFDENSDLIPIFDFFYKILIESQSASLLSFSMYCVRKHPTNA